MSVYFVYRSAYEYPLGRRILTFDDVDLLAWFHRVWPKRKKQVQSGGDEIERHIRLAKKAGLKDIYGIWYLFDLMESTESIPQTHKALRKWLDQKPYPEGRIHAREHAWQSQTDDDELDLAVMMFDDTFAEKNQDRVSFLLYPELELPTNTEKSPSRFAWRGFVNDLSPKGKSNGAVYAILLIIEDSCWLTDLLGPFRFKGVRLPEFAAFLRNVPQSEIDKSNAIEQWNAPGKWRDELVQFREIAKGMNADDSERSHFEIVVKAYEKMERRKFNQLDQSNANWIRKRMPSKIQSDEHFLQIAFRTKSTFEMNVGPDLKDEINLQWYFFDDLWAGSYPDLAKSLLHFANDPIPLF